MFIGREDELKFLEERYVSGNAQMIVLYGRRRTGKTELLKHFCEGKEHVFYSCMEVTDEQQLGSFSEAVLTAGIDAGKYIRRFSDWERAFQSITELPFQRKTVIIDEFPYMVQKNHSIPSILQKLWDGGLKEQNIFLVLCGSAMSFMEKEILAEKNPLYGRATGILKLNPMSFYEAIRFVPSYSPEDKIAVYAILGGIPHYLKQFQEECTLGENICNQILTRGSILYSEVEFLLRQEMRETATYNTIIRAIAMGCTRLNEISQKTLIESTKLNVYLRNLMEMGIVYREFSVETGIKESANVQKGLYRLTDHFFRFYYAFAFPNISALESGDAEGVYEYVVKPELASYISYVYEDVCRQYLMRMNRKRKLPGYYTKFGRWWNKSEEIDIIGTDAEKKHFLVGECKYRNQPMGEKDCIHTEEKWNPVLDTVYYYFSKSGFAPDAVRHAEETGARLVSLEDLVNG